MVPATYIYRLAIVAEESVEHMTATPPLKVAILAGGTGSRLAEETETKPKPMVEIGGIPIMWHIMNHYAAYDHKDFVIALGYKGEVIKRYVLDQTELGHDLSVNLADGRVKIHKGETVDWNIRLVDTALETQTGGRIKRLAPYLGSSTFMLTWGDGVSDVDLDQLLAFHRSHGKLATLTAVRPPARFGHLELTGDQIVEFSEKPQAQEGWINGAFFVLEPEIFDYIDGDATHFEKEPLERLARAGQLMAYRHESFWQCMDTIRERILLETLWKSGNAPWKINRRKDREPLHAGTTDRTRGLYWDSHEPRTVGARS
jgi:glucose-1-phosphate cytidylyltransferase